jgi:hypothetical protein
MPCSRLMQLAGFIFAVCFYSLLSKVRSICNYHSSLMKHGFTCRDNINTGTKKNHCWSSQNPHLTQEVPLHLVKVGVWCAVSARRIVVYVFHNETINFKRLLCVEGQHFQHLLWSLNCNYFIPNVIGRQAY